MSAAIVETDEVKTGRDGQNAGPVGAEAPVDTPAAPPAPPPKPLWLAVLYMAGGYLFFIAQGLGLNMVNANLYQLQGEFSATVVEVVWLSAVYMAPYASLSMALFKIRMQYGLRPFAELSLVVFLVASCLNFFVSDLHSALVIRFFSGMAAAPLSSLGFLYILEAFPPQKKLSMGLGLALIGTLVTSPLARLISPPLLEIGGWQSLYTIEIGLALVALPIIYLMPLTPPPRVKVIERVDVLSYLLMALGLGLMAVFFTVARFYWWFDTWWLGVMLAVALSCLTGFAAIELQRENPLIDLRWVFSRTNLHMAAVLIIYRAVSSEQSSTAVGLYQQLGLQNDQTMTINAIILAASIGGGLFCTWLMATRFVETAHVIALALIAAGAFMDSYATSVTRPEQMYLSQGMIAMGAAMFLPPVMASGFGRALQKGMPYVVNFIAIFLFTQISGSVITTSLLGTFVTIREKFHSSVLVENLVLSNPLVAQRVSQLASAYKSVISDSTLLNAEGAALLAQKVTVQAYVMAYNDTFLLISVVAALSLVALLLHLGWNRISPIMSQSRSAETPMQS